MSSRQFFADIQFGSSDMVLSYGSGSPESNKTAEISSLYIRSNATNSATSLYVKDSGSGNTGWTPVAIIPPSGSAQEIVFIGSSGNLSSASDFLFNGSVLTVPSNTTIGNLSITFQGDTNTGIQGLTGDQMAFRIANETVLLFDFVSLSTQSSFMGNVLISDGHLNINDQYEIQLQEEVSNGNAYVAIRAGSNMTGASGSYTLTLPEDAPSDGEVLEWNTSASAFIWATPSGGGSGSSVSFNINQASPSLSLLDSVYHDGSVWQKAQSDNPDTLGTHIVTSASGDDYTLCQSGRITATSHGLTIGEYYFTSDATPGLLTATEPSQYSNPLVYVEDANIIHVLPFRPSAINGALPPTYIKSIGIENPGSSENIALFFTDDAITVTQVNDVCRGSSPSVTWNIFHDTARDSGTPNSLFSSDRTTTSLSGAETTSFNDASIPAGSWVWFRTSATSGTVGEFTVSLEYSKG